MVRRIIRGVANLRANTPRQSGPGWEDYYRAMYPVTGASPVHELRIALHQTASALIASNLGHLIHTDYTPPIGDVPLHHFVGEDGVPGDYACFDAQCSVASRNSLFNQLSSIEARSHSVFTMFPFFNEIDGPYVFVSMNTVSFQGHAPLLTTSTGQVSVLPIWAVFGYATSSSWQFRQGVDYAFRRIDWLFRQYRETHGNWPHDIASVYARVQESQRTQATFPYEQSTPT